MAVLRYALLTATACAMLAVIGFAKTQGNFENPIEVGIFLAGAAILFGNFFYLLEVTPKNSTRLGLGRVGGLFRLWLDAKEGDLRARATAAGSPRNEASDASRHKS